MMWITPGISFFRLVAPPLQPRVVGSYLVRGVWFSSHLPLEGTDHIQNVRVVTNGLRYPRYFTQTVASSLLLSRGKKLPLNGRHNRCSYVIVDNSMGFSGEVVGPEPPGSRS
jgi:hypothetical protein